MHSQLYRGKLTTSTSAHVTMRNNQHRASESRKLRRDADEDIDSDVSDTGTYVIDSDEELNAAMVSKLTVISLSSKVLS